VDIPGVDDNVSVVLLQSEGQPDLWRINIRGLLLVETATLEGVLNFFDDYIPSLAATITDAEEGIERCRAIHAKVVALKIKIQEMIPPGATFVGAN
jgi:hypothetical protein